MEKEIEKKLDKLLDKLDLLLDEKNGLRISGMGMLANNTDDMKEKLDKIQKFLYFMEKRQLEWKQEFEKVNNLSIERDKSKA